MCERSALLAPSDGGIANVSHLVYIVVMCEWFSITNRIMIIHPYLNRPEMSRRPRSMPG